MNTVISIHEKFASFTDLWSPKVITQLNGQDVKLAKIKGEFVWHKHDHEDELFYVIKGDLHMAFRDRVECLSPGDMITVPRGVEHKPIAEEEVWIMLFEPSTTGNTGNVKDERTRHVLDHI